ncbi:MAG: HU family DNA-binding protein [Proteobacteria bacterium]|nr:HU family DNA-binding protein [Pseudomonadota bacterium]
MAMQLKKIERPNPMNRDDKRWYLTKAPGRTIGINEIAQEIEKRSTTSKSDIMGVLVNLVELIPEHVSRGDSVKLGDLGIFRAIVTSQSAPTSAEINANMVKNVRVSFIASTEIKKAIGGIKFQVV